MAKIIGYDEALELIGSALQSDRDTAEQMLVGLGMRGLIAATAEYVVFDGKPQAQWLKIPPAAWEYNHGGEISYREFIMRDGRVHQREVYASLLHFDLDEIQKLELARINEAVSELMRKLDRLGKRRRGRFQNADRLLLARMRELLRRGAATTVTKAARMVAEQAPGKDAIRRLVSKYHEQHGIEPGKPWTKGGRGDR